MTDAKSARAVRKSASRLSHPAGVAMLTSGMKKTTTNKSAKKATSAGKSKPAAKKATAKPAAKSGAKSKPAAGAKAKAKPVGAKAVKSTPSASGAKKAQAGKSAPSKGKARRAAAHAKATTPRTRRPNNKLKPAAAVEPVVDVRPDRPKPAPEAGIEFVLKALHLALEKKARDPVLLDVQALCSYCNYQLVLTAQSDRQVEAIADAVTMGLKLDDLRPMGREGHRSAQWALLDYGDFIVHIFHKDVREHYDLEGLWSDARRVPLELPPEAVTRTDDLYA